RPLAVKVFYLAWILSATQRPNALNQLGVDRARRLGQPVGVAAAAGQASAFDGLEALEECFTMLGPARAGQQLRRYRDHELAASRRSTVFVVGFARLETEALTDRAGCQQLHHERDG